jgi:S1-C subfamily serine protease
MADQENWSFPNELQPRSEQVDFDLDAALDAVVMLRAEIPEDAFTASILGTERAGNGVVIREDGLVLTIGYLITEATTVWVTNNRGAAVPGYPLAYDQVTGFGLVQPLGRLDAPSIPLGSAAPAAVGDEVVVIGHGGRSHALKARIIGKHEFAGYWEYLLDEALFTSPAHPQWAGTALLDERGRLIGIGSLFVQELQGGKTIDGNMMVPIDALPPIMDDLVRTGSAKRPPRAWLGMYTTESSGKLVVVGLAENGPAHRAGIRRGDQIIEVAGDKPASLADLFRRIWHLGPAGTEVPLTVSRAGDVLRVRLRSADRNDFLKKPQLH